MPGSSYGYPYVFDEFRFHMTLSDRLDPEAADEIKQAASTWFAPVLEAPLLLDRLCLYHETDAGKPFTRIADFALGGAK